MFYLQNIHTLEYAREDSRGQHDALTTRDPQNAKRFGSWGEASVYWQNFGDDWNVVEL